MRELTKKFPEILFEGCASGGNRFDLGILSFFPQIWASDDTDALCRSEIQNGYSYGYPMSTVTAHVSDCPNHQTLRRTPIETRFNVASFGVLGYECNLNDMSKEDFEDLKRKHRASENKAIVKANMEYLKDMIKHELGKAGSIPGMGGGQSASAAVGSPVVQGVTVSMPAMAAPVSDGASIDVSI